jgi:hypothetical protein
MKLKEKTSKGIKSRTNSNKKIRTKIDKTQTEITHLVFAKADVKFKVRKKKRERKKKENLSGIICCFFTCALTIIQFIPT